MAISWSLHPKEYKLLKRIYREITDVKFSCQLISGYGSDWFWSSSWICKPRHFGPKVGTNLACSAILQINSPMSPSDIFYHIETSNKYFLTHHILNKIFFPLITSVFPIINNRQVLLPCKTICTMETLIYESCLKATNMSKEKAKESMIL